MEVYLVFLLPAVLLLLCLVLLRILIRTRKELKEFAEAVGQGDLTRKFPEHKPGMGAVNKELNSISRSVSGQIRRYEARQHYLKKILELVDTGILAYHTRNYDVLWINEALGNILDIPMIKNLKWLRKHDEGLNNLLTGIPPGSNQLLTVWNKGQTMRIMTNAALFETEGEQYKLIAFHNVRQIMEEAEANAWKGLLDVMTHEIMNSVTPVSSLAETLRKQLSALKEEHRLDKDKTVEDIEAALEAIKRRSDGLLLFSENYRSLNRKIVPELKPVNLIQPVNSVCQLMNPSLKQKGIRLEIKGGDAAVEADIDQPLIEQALINFITNAAHALAGRPDPCIMIYAGMSDGRPYITVADNGTGIADNIRDKIFVPFFTTRKGGSGIGLSLTREIVKLHQAELHVQTKEGEGTAFSILFRNKNNP